RLAVALARVQYRVEITCPARVDCDLCGPFVLQQMEVPSGGQCDGAAACVRDLEHSSDDELVGCRLSRLLHVPHLPTCPLNRFALGHCHLRTACCEGRPGDPYWEDDERERDAVSRVRGGEVANGRRESGEGPGGITPPQFQNDRADKCRD